VAAAFYWWRAARGRSWRTALTVALIGGLLGAVALGALAGARRTASAYGRYLQSIHSSDVFVDIPGPVLAAIPRIAALPAVRPGQSAAWLGLAANPVIHGRVDESFLDDNLVGSYSGAGSHGDDYFRQDRMTVVAGRLPPLDATGQIALTASMARKFGVGVGGKVTWQFYRQTSPDAFKPAGRSTFLVTGIVDAPPVLVDQFDAARTAVLPPAATARYTRGQFYFAWVGLRLTRGAAGIPAFQSELDRLELELSRSLHNSQVLFTIRRMDTVHDSVQQAIRPQAAALAVFGALAALAMLVLVGQGMAQLLNRSAAEIAVLRAVGATRSQAALAVGLDGAVTVLAGVAVAVAGAYLVSPLAPVGAVHRFDPARGFEADPLVLAGGGAVLSVVLLGLLAGLAWRAVSPAVRIPSDRPSVLAAAAASAGLPVTAVIGTRHALETGFGQRPAAVRAALLGSAAAVTAVIAAVVFGASLGGLVTHPARYGWDWNLLMDAQGGYGAWKPAAMDRLVDHQPGVLGWSQFGFTQVAIDGQEVPVLGLQRELGSVQPPTTSGHPLAAPGQIELGVSTLRQLGKHIGDQVMVGSGKLARKLTIAGTATLPSFGIILADHVSLGRGAMLPESTLLAIQGVTGTSGQQAATAYPGFPSAAAIEMAPGSSADARRLVRRITAADPDQSPGGIYPLGPQRGEAIANASQMGRQPLALALALAAAAVLALALTLLASVRQRRRQLAVLKALGLSRRQLREIVAWQASVILVVAALIGVPLGVAAGRWAWASFASSVGAVPVSVVPVTALILGLAALLVAGNLLAAIPAAIAARTAPAAALRAE
jgi:ABC-type lipoprotein release transport system permease subunit